jgi:hypothetical protein
MFLGSIAALFFNFTIDVARRARDCLIGRRRALNGKSQAQTTVE